MVNNSAYRSSINDDFKSTVVAYSEFLRKASERLSHSATDVSISCSNGSIFLLFAFHDISFSSHCRNLLFILPQGLWQCFYHVLCCWASFLN